MLARVKSGLLWVMIGVVVYCVVKKIMHLAQVLRDLDGRFTSLNNGMKENMEQSTKHDAKLQEHEQRMNAQRLTLMNYEAALLSQQDVLGQLVKEEPAVVEVEEVTEEECDEGDAQEEAGPPPEEEAAPPLEEVPATPEPKKTKPSRRRGS